MREALRILAEAGLIARRRGAGTIVIASQARAAFSQRLGNVDDLMQYARDARLQPQDSETVMLDAPLARLLGVTPGGRYQRVRGLRGEPNAPALAFTRIFIREDLAPPTEVLVELGGLVTEWIAQNKAVPTARIEQSISAGSLSAEEAQALSAAPGGPALRTRRRYYDSSGRIIALSDSVHPAERFTYEMVLKRETGEIE